MELDLIHEKALLHILSEKAGFEEAKVYWDLSFQKDDIDFSHNKKYRLLQHLYQRGFLFKMKNENAFKYIPVPISSVVVDEDIGEDILNSLDEMYCKVFLDDLMKDNFLIETNGKNLDGLILFFIRNLMKKDCSIVFGGSVLYGLLKDGCKEDFDKIKFIGIERYFESSPSENLKLRRKELIADKRFIVIDGKYLLVFFKLFNDFYFGYFSTDDGKISKKMEEFDFIWNF